MLLLDNFYDLFLDAAPWLLGGLVIAGLIHSFVATETLAKHLGQDSLLAITKAAVFGAPLPLCSCSVIPAAISLRRNGASRSATVSFLVSTPETGVDSIAVSYALLGPFMAIIRPISAILSAIAAGVLTLTFKEKTFQNDPLYSEINSSVDTESNTTENNTEASSCCSKKSCGSSTTQKAVATPGIFDRFIQGQRYAFIDIFNDMAGWLLVGLLLAAMTLTWVPESFLTQWGDGFSAMLVMALVGVPMYICATASTPIAAGLLLAGISPGAVLVFMLAGPATNMATIGIVKRELGTRAVACYLAGVLSVAFAAGLITNALVATFAIDIKVQLAASQHLLPHGIMLASALILALLIINYGRSRLFKLNVQPLPSS